MAKFKTRARAIDMLGRQQIAGSSTAISELFKNAHDAYAEHAEGDYFKSDSLLVIRDDGFGMTPEEFEDKWLVLGTESKMQLKNAGAAYRPPGKKERAIMGEKGIGRLAIALLGRQVLVLTRAKRGNVTHDLVMSFLHWGIFELPGLNLDEIEIPVRRITGSRLPSATEVGQLVEDNRALVTRLKKRHDVKAILDDLDDFQIDPQNIDSSIKGLSLADGRCGTHFYIAPANSSIGIEIEYERKEQTKEFTKFLIGFCNSTFLTTDAPPIQTAFRYWETDESCEDIVGPGEFFTTEEVAKADHKVSGTVDEFGQFKGNIRVYDAEHPNHVIPWREGHGKKTACGPFTLEFAYLQGAQRESRADPEDWARLNAKLENIGGLYVYRDRIRILPYGNSDVDWVDIELRRNKGAGYYFFSWRRLFGAVCLTRRLNGDLHEKAGREGFQQDKAYRQFKGILVNFFIQLAADFFRDNKEDPTYFQTKKRELELLELARRRREKMVSTKRRNLTSALDAFFQRTAQKLPEAEIDQLKRQMELRMANAAALKDPDDASTALLETERVANSKLSALRESYRVARPRGVGLSQQLQRDWEGYAHEQERLETELFSPFSAEMARTLGKFAEKAKLYVDQRRRVEELLKQLAEEKRKAVRTGAKDLTDKAEQTQQAALRTARDAIHQFQTVVAEVESDFARQDFAKMPPERVEEVRGRFEQKIEEVGRRNTETLAKVRDLLAGIAQNLEPGELDVTGIETMEALEKDLESLKEQANSDAELVQLGLAVAVINHEFEAAIKGIRGNLRDLHSWARSNHDLSPLYQKIRNNFDHLDGHLNLFTPLQRRLYREPINIKGSDINHYVGSLFDVRLKRHHITIRATPGFLASSMTGYPSTIYPVFVNVIDNAIFWLGDKKEAGEIVLDSDMNDFLIINNGPPVAARDRTAIFEQGFTRKPRGRGLGLFISRRALQKEGMDIKLEDSGSERGTIFRIVTHA